MSKVASLKGLSGVCILAALGLGPASGSEPMTIEIEHLCRRFGSVVAIDDLSFEVGAGEILGFLGPNGAGKTTTMKVIAGFLAASAGHVRVGGHDVERSPLAVKRIIGYLPEGAPAWPDMTPLGLLRFAARVRNMPHAFRDRRLALLVEQLGLEEVLLRPTETLSKGFRRRVGLALALLHDPEVLILDEPTDGLDPNQKRQVRELIRSLSREKIVVVSTHILEEVEAVCTRAVVIRRGRLVADDTPEALAARSRWHGAIGLRLAGPVTASVFSGVDGVVGVEEVDRDGCAWTLFVAAEAQGGAAVDAVRARLDASGCSVRELWLHRGRLDEVFHELTLDAPEAA